MPDNKEAGEPVAITILLQKEKIYCLKVAIYGLDYKLVDILEDNSYNYMDIKYGGKI